MNGVLWRTSRRGQSLVLALVVVLVDADVEGFASDVEPDAFVPDAPDVPEAPELDE